MNWSKHNTLRGAVWTNLSVLWNVFVIIITWSFRSADGQCSPTTIPLYVTPTDAPLTLTSPNYPNIYPSSIQCRWSITAPSSHRVHIEVHDFQLEGSSSSCSYDHLDVIDDPESDPRAELCGDSNPGSITSTGPTITLQFITDTTVQNHGFNITYTAFAVGTNCPSSWNKFGPTCYKVKTDTKNWDDAQLSCGLDAANLASISGPGENQLIKSYLPDSGPYWIGLRHMSSSFQWIDRSDVIYSNFNDLNLDQSSDMCVYMSAASEYWYNTYCSSLYYPYVCQKNIYGTTKVYSPEISHGDSEDSGLQGWQIGLIIFFTIIILIWVKGYWNKHCKNRNSTRTTTLVRPVRPEVAQRNDIRMADATTGRDNSTLDTSSEQVPSSLPPAPPYNPDFVPTERHELPVTPPPSYEEIFGNR